MVIHSTNRFIYRQSAYLPFHIKQDHYVYSGPVWQLHVPPLFEYCCMGIQFEGLVSPLHYKTKSLPYLQEYLLYSLAFLRQYPLDNLIECKQCIFIVFYVIFYIFSTLLNNCMSFRFQLAFLCFYSTRIFGI